MSVYIPFIVLAVCVVLLFGLGILISQLGQKVCLSAKCAAEAKLMASSFNSNISPCDNFYKFTCDNYGKTKQAGGIDSILEELEKKQIWRVVRYLSLPDQDEDHRLLWIAKDIYRRCINLDFIEEEGLLPINMTMFDSGGFPLIEGELWEHFRAVDWSITVAEVFSYLKGFATSHFFEAYVQKYEGRKNRHLPFVSIPTRLKNTVKLDFDTYYKYTKEIYAILHGSDDISDEYEKELKETVNLKIKILNLIKGTTNCSKNIYEIISVRGFRNLVKKLGDIDNFWLDVTEGNAVYTEVVMTEGFKDYIVGLDHLIANTSLRVAANYVAIEHIIQVTPFLPSKLRESYDRYLRTEQEKTNKILNNRKLHCAKLIKDSMKTPLSTLYMWDHPSILGQTYITEDLTNRIKTELKKLIKNAWWMDRKNQYETILKVEKAAFETPLPKDVIERLMNESAFSMYYWTICITRNSTLADYLSLTISRIHKNVLLAIPLTVYYIYNEEYDIFSTEITYDHERNAMIIPMGFLRYPVFDKNWPKYLNYGALGSRLTHELIIGIDFAGNKYGLDTHRNWWSNSTTTQYQKERLCFVDQYNQYIVPLAKRNITDPHCIEENIAYGAGVEVSFLAYQVYSKERFFQEAKLPGMVHYTINQHFFIDFATFFCTQNDKVYHQNMTEGEVGEASNEFIVVSSLQNFLEFSETFDCKRGDKMNPSQRCKIW